MSKNISETSPGMTPLGFGRLLPRVKKLWLDAMITHVRPHEYHPFSLILTLLGYKLFRIALYHAIYAVRGLSYRLPANAGPHNLYAAAQDLERTGLVSIPSYFDETTYRRLSEVYATLMDEKPYTHGATGCKIRTTIIYAHDRDPLKKFVYDLFVNDATLTALVEFNLRKRMTRMPRVELQDLHLPPGNDDVGDGTTVPHADRYFHHPKLYFYMNDQASEDGAYTYAHGSHRYDAPLRLVHEYEIGVRDAWSRLRRRLGIKLPTTPLRENGLDCIRPYFLDKLHMHPVTIGGKANTFVVTDNRGVHARGIMSPGGIRRQVRIQYQYLEMPWYARLMLAITKKVSPITVDYFA
jgi:hypothetical protein